MKYSIITINYNDKDGLEKTIKSVISQTYTDYEFIVIDGGSCDGSKDVILQYAGKIDFWVSEKDNGIYNAMNKGIAQAKGDYLNFMNSGDAFHSDDVLERISQSSDADIIYGKYKKSTEPVAWFLPVEDVTLYDLYRGTLNHQASFISRKLFENSFYDEKLKIVSDWKFFLQKLVFENCTFFRADVIVVDYDATGFSAKNVDLYYEERKNVLRENLPERIRKDYELLRLLDYDAMEILPKLNQYPGMYKWLIRIAKVMLKCNRLFKKRK